MKKITKLTEAQKTRFPFYVDRWKAIGLSTTPIDRVKHDAAVAGVYKLADMAAPRMIYTPCPFSGTLAASIYQSLTDSAVGSAVDSAVDSAVGSAVDSAVGSAVDSAVDSAVGSAVDSAVRSTVYSAVRSAVRSAVESTADSAVRSAVYSAVESTADSAVRSAVYYAVYSAVDSAVGSAVDSAKLQGVECLCGNQWAGYAAWAEFFANECGVNVNRDCLDMMEYGHYIWPFKNVCFASEKPCEIRVDAQGRSHCETGPSVEYATGWGPYCWHGVLVPPNWIIDRTSLTAVEALQQDNMELRRVACEIVGWHNILRELKAKTIDKPGNPFIGELLEVDIPNVGKERFLRVKCGTSREFALPVPPDMKRASQAQAWLNWTDETMYIPQLRT